MLCGFVGDVCGGVGGCVDCWYVVDYVWCVGYDWVGCVGLVYCCFVCGVSVDWYCLVVDVVVELCGGVLFWCYIVGDVC